MKKNSLKYFINALLFIDICSTAIIGLLLGFVIPKGNGHPGTRYFLGLPRHQWGDIHLYLAVLLLILLAVHLWLNWTWVVQSTKRYFGDNWEKALCVISGAWALVLLMAWIATKR
jgi:hypothetical protein